MYFLFKIHYYLLIIIVKSKEFMVNNYFNFINMFYDKELLPPNYSKLNDFILIHCGLYINYITICFNTFEAYFSYKSHILSFP